MDHEQKFHHAPQGVAKKIDPYGDNVATAQGVPGDHWRTQHDALKWTIYDLWRQFGGTVVAEVTGIFSYLLEQREVFDGLPGRTRRGMVPDLMFVNGATGRRWLADVKTLHRGSSTYKRSDVREGVRGRAVERRANAVHSEYVRKAKRLDREFGPQLAEGETGLVEAKLAEFGRVRGFVFGASGESSPDVEAFIHELGAMGASRSWRNMGARSELEAKGLIKQMAREAIGIAIVRGNARCKLDKLGAAMAGEEAYAAYRRADRFGYDEQRRFRRNLDGHRRARRFDGPRHHRNW